MANTVKKKIRWGTVFLFLLALLSGGVGIFNMVQLKADANEILKDNYESLDYCHAMQRGLDSFSIDRTGSVVKFEKALQLQEANVTEAGEREATSAIRRYFNQLEGRDSMDATAIRAEIDKILQLNMSAIESKNEKASSNADRALRYISLIAAIIFIVGFTFSLNFPSILTSPIGALSKGISEIGKKNYSYRIHLDRKDEFGQMADSFNDMAERLEYFENSNLNKLIFEKKRAEAVINSLREASIGMDKNGVILFANGQALQLLGMESGAMIGKPANEIAKQNDLFRFLLEEKSSLPFKIVVDNRENYFTREEMEIPQDDLGSKVIVLRNITSFKELDVAKTNFIATISHELKTPLASSDFSLKLLEDERVGILSTEQKELIENLKNDNQRMLRILSELLNMSQAEAGKIQLEIVEAHPEKLADTAITAMLNTARQKNVVIQKQYESGLDMIHVDVEKTGWVLNNFLTNAIRHSREAGLVTVSISKNQDNIEFSVSDDGPGIAAEYLDKVFDRFFKVPGSRPGGTGLGLAISKELIEAQGGSVWVKSEIGVGSRFGFLLPVGDSETV